MLLEILWSLEGFTAKVTLVWLQWNVNPNVRCDMVTLDCSSTTVCPSTGQVEVVSRLSTNVLLTDVLL